MKNIRKKAVRIMLLFAWTLFFLHIDTYAASGNTTRIHFIALYGASDAILLRVTVISEWLTPEKTGIIRVVLQEVNIHIDMELQRMKDMSNRLFTI